MTQKPSEYTIRSVAREYAGQFYEQKRSDRFRSKNSLTRAIKTVRLKDGTEIEQPVVMRFFDAYPDATAYANAHWPFFYEAARKSLVTMLALPDSRISPQMKEAIKDALIEDRDKQFRYEARRGPAPTLLQQDPNREQQK